MAGRYKSDLAVIYAVEKMFYKKLSFEEGYEVWLSSQDGESSMYDMSEDFPSRIVEKLGRQRFAEKIGAKQEYAQYTQELAPYMEELKKAQAKKEAAEWKKIEKEAGVSSRVPTDIKEHEVIMSYLLKRGHITKRQAEGLKEWEKVDDKVGARRRKFLEPHLLQGTLAQKIERVKHILNTMGATRIQVRQEEREKHNERVRARNGEKRERKEYKQGKREEKEEKKREAERKEAFDNLSSHEKRLVEDAHYYHPRKIKKRKAE